jgi:hypothetical protein
MSGERSSTTGVFLRNKISNPITSLFSLTSKNLSSTNGIVLATLPSLTLTYIVPASLSYLLLNSKALSVPLVCPHYCNHLHRGISLIMD